MTIHSSVYVPVHYVLKFAEFESGDLNNGQADTFYGIDNSHIYALIHALSCHNSSSLYIVEYVVKKR
jgi:hypothetical protein